MLLTLAALIAFAANSILCRMALAGGDIDALSFSLIRLASGALALSLLLMFTGHNTKNIGGNWLSALMLMLYVVPFSLAYLSLSAASGALILFAAVQFTMLLGAIGAGRIPGTGQSLAMALAMGGLVYLLFPGLDSPSPTGAAMMLLSGAAWGIYSLRGGGIDPLLHTSGNFIRALLLSLPLLLVLQTFPRTLPASILSALPIAVDMHASLTGMLLAMCSGAIASGLGYALWYAALRKLEPLFAGIVQLSVPVMTAFAGVIILNEPLTFHLLSASALILCGILLALSLPTARLHYS